MYSDVWVVGERWKEKVKHPLHQQRPGPHQLSGEDWNVFFGPLTSTEAFWIWSTSQVQIRSALHCGNLGFNIVIASCFHYGNLGQKYAKRQYHNTRSIHPAPQTLSPEPETLDPQPKTLNPKSN